MTTRPVKVLQVQDLPVNAQAPLRSDQRTQFVKMIRNQFEAKRSLFHAQSRIERDNIMAQYRKSVGFEKLKDKLAQAQSRVKQAKEAIFETGLSETGEKLERYHIQDNETRKLRAYNKLRQILRAIKDNAPDVQLEDKLVSRMLLSTTHGEAIVILRSVLGNELIPSVTKDQLQITNQS
jgi:Zn-dependent metalloprotease